jgi:hypothetical protein
LLGKQECCLKVRLDEGEVTTSGAYSLKLLKEIPEQLHNGFILANVLWVMKQIIPELGVLASTPVGIYAV